MGTEASTSAQRAPAGANGKQAGKATGAVPITIEYLMEIVDAFNRHDLEAITGYFAEDGEFLTARGPEPFGRRLKGKAAIGEYLGNRYKSVPDMRWTDERHFVSGNRALSEWTVSGTVAGGERMEWRGCDIWEFDSQGKITVKDTFWKYIEKAGL